MQSGVDGKVPVFVFPNTITFYIEDQSTHKQVLTIYNPYDLAVKFKVLCTAPKKYTVVDPEGSIKPQCCIDIVIRHNVVTQNNCHITDKFRIQMFDHVTKQVIGKRDVTATLISGESGRSTPDKEFFEQLSPSKSSKLPQQQYSIVQRADPRSDPNKSSGPNIIILTIAAVCIVALLLPTEGDDSSLTFKLPVHLKLVFSYVLGLVTMVILKPH
uniref:Motile sperm domain-containing protein 3 n=1 Tax=Clastoptera arizonana TaxID=38151 RepID=A0A1B6D1E0_9HEMI